MKKIIALFIIIALLAFAKTKSGKIEKYLAEDRYYSILAMAGMAERCYNPHKHAAEMFIQEGFDYKQADKQAIQDSFDKITEKNIDESTQPKIPTITHHVFFTSETNSAKLSDFYIEEFKINFSRLNSIDKTWKHNIWTNVPELFPEEVTSIKGVKVRSITEFQQHPLYNKITEAVKEGVNYKARFAEASDLSRLLILQKFGGIYSDMDYEIYNAPELFSYMKRFDFIGGREHIRKISYYANSFIATKPDHPIINEAIEKLLRNYRRDLKDTNTPDYIKYPCTENDRIYSNGPMLMTIAYLSKNNLDGNKDVILPPWMLLNLDFSHYKNKVCDYSQISREAFIKNTDNLDRLLEDYIKNIIDNREGNIYYSLKTRQSFPIIGADMGCGTWVTLQHPRLWHWKKW